MTLTQENGFRARLSKQIMALYVVGMLVATAFIGVFGFVPDEVSGEEEYDMGNVVAMWKMDENGGGTVYDETDNDNDGTINGTTWTDGRNCSGLSFAGGGSSYVSVPHDESLEIDDGDYTIEAWVYPESRDDSERSEIISARSGMNEGFSVGIGGKDDRWHKTGTLILYHWGSTGGGNSTSVVTLNSWTHVAVSYDYSEETFKMYINGKLDKTGSAGHIVSYSNGVEIGREMYDDNKGLDGLIDEVVIHNKSLAPSEFYGLRYMPDLKVKESGIEFSAEPAVGEKVLVNVTVENVGYTGIEHWQITKEDYDQTSPAFSLDGTKIAYSSKEDGGSYEDIWVMNVDGKNHTQFTNEDSGAIRPFYSPDSQTIYYSEGTPNWDIHKMDSNGENNTQIIGGSGDQVAGGISPDGKDIVYFEDDSFSNTWRFLLAKNDGTDKRQLTTDEKGRNYPSFNTNGTKIV